MSDRSLRIEYHSCIPSTNDLAAVRWDSETDLIIADSQSGGKGRMGRRFESPTGGLYMSLIVRRPIPTGRLLRITPLAAVAVRRALAEIGLDCGIKWVNDLIADGKKVCGILVQPKFEGESCIGAIFGIGVNLRSGVIPDDLRAIAASVQDIIGTVPDRNSLAIAISRHLVDLLDAPDDAPAMGEYAAASTLIGKRVTVTQPARCFEATAVAIDGEGFLHVQTDHGSELVLGSGEATLHRE